MINRIPTKKIFVGNVAVGGDAPISTQSMTYSQTHDVEATVEQIKRLHFAGCDIVRCAVPDMKDALALKLPLDMRVRFQKLARSNDITPSQLIRAYIKNYIVENSQGEIF